MSLLIIPCSFLSQCFFVRTFSTMSVNVTVGRKTIQTSFVCDPSSRRLNFGCLMVLKCHTFKKVLFRLNFFLRLFLPFISCQEVKTKVNQFCFTNSLTFRILFVTISEVRVLLLLRFFYHLSSEDRVY